MAYRSQQGPCLETGPPSSQFGQNQSEPDASSQSYPFATVIDWFSLFIQIKMFAWIRTSGDLHFGHGNAAGNGSDTLGMTTHLMFSSLSMGRVC